MCVCVVYKVIISIMLVTKLRVWKYIPRMRKPEAGIKTRTTT